MITIRAFRKRDQGFKFYGEKINPLVATKVHMRRLRAIQQGSRPRISRLEMSNNKKNNNNNKQIIITNINASTNIRNNTKDV